MYILGISCYYHDSSATLVKDGIVIAAAEEERFSRKKHDSSFPQNAIKFCLEKAEITIQNIDYITFYEKPLLKFERILYQHLEMYPWSLKAFIKAMPSWINEKLRIIKTIQKKLKYKKNVFFIEHHMSHAASAFLPSPFEKAAILTVDGVGEWSTTTFGIGKKNNIKLLKEIRFPHSLGLLYSTITAYLGFSVNNSEYKVMGLSAYGEKNKQKNKYYSLLKKVIDIKKDGSYALKLKYFKYHYSDRMPSGKLCKLLGGPIRKKESKITQKEKDIAAALQLITEEVMIKMLNHLYNTTKTKNLVLAGGVALNSVLNGKILQNSPFKNVWIQPNASDGGTSLGAALYTDNVILGNQRKYKMESPYLGPSYSNDEVEKFLQQNSINYNSFSSEADLIDETAKLIHEDNVIGWFQKGMEWGPRALGARSIISNAGNPKMQEILNLKVKHREKFRPFAPVVCADDAMTYFECDDPLPESTDYMLMVYPIVKSWHEKIPSVTHIDGSGRLQSIRREQNPLYYDLIKKFGEISGIPILINTSFNIRGEPIVCTPLDAYKCMMGTEIDYLVINNFIIKRSDNLIHAWDSEKLAID